MDNFFPKRHQLILPGVLLLILSMFSSCIDGAAENQDPAQEFVQAENDKGKEPWVMNIEESTIENPHYRIAEWTGESLQMVLMSLKPGEVIVLERHDQVDQFIRIEQGEAQVLMGKDKKELSYEKTVSDDWAIFVPAGFYHKITNSGNNDLKLYTIYAPAVHPKGVLNKTFKEAEKYHERMKKSDDH